MGYSLVMTDEHFINIRRVEGLKSAATSRSLGNRGYSSRTNAQIWLFVCGIRVSVNVRVSAKARLKVVFDKIDIRCYTWCSGVGGVHALWLV